MKPVLASTASDPGAVAPSADESAKSADGGAWTDERPPWTGLPVGRRVLIAEDDATLRDIFATVLRERGYQVATVSTGTELHRVLDTASLPQPFDLIITDVIMPGISGLDVIDELRRSGDTTPVVIVTAFAQSEVQQRARGLEVRLLSKPFELETLRSAVDWAIRAKVFRGPGPPWPR
ncbi:MAG: response regulator [Myxococcales bacterium]